MRFGIRVRWIALSVVLAMVAIVGDSFYIMFNERAEFKRGINPLCKAAAYGDTKLMAKLLRQGVSPNAVGTDGICSDCQDSPGRAPALFYAVFGTQNNGEQMAATKLLLTAGANINARGHDGMTVLMWVHSVKMAKLLIAHGADVNARDNQGRTALTWQYEGSAEINKVLAQHGTPLQAHPAPL